MRSEPTISANHFLTTPRCYSNEGLSFYDNRTFYDDRRVIRGSYNSVQVKRIGSRAKINLRAQDVQSQASKEMSSETNSVLDGVWS
ncbi:hypothetical protein TNCV_2825571 [Trichonephila clavipes]|nr:hypothetical protein TNCV_2825571 [Trichonephila clavipes]